MKFKLVMWILALRLRWLAWRNPKMQEKLQGKDMVMQWRTVAGKPARFYHFLPGRVVSRAQLHDKPGFSISFKDAPYAMDLLMQASKNQAVFMGAIQSGDVKIEGDFAQLMWFMGLMKLIFPAKKKS